MFAFAPEVYYNGNCRGGKMYDYVFKASLIGKKAVTIIYQKGNEITERKVRVTSIKENEITAYCYLRHQYRHFKKENILAASCTH